MIRRFREVEGRYIEKILGQERLAFAHSDTNDFYDLIEWSKSGGYQGSIILFFDFASGNVYKPFAKKRNVVYSDPVYAGGFYYFLQGEVNLYNLRIIGEPVHVISQEERFECYYPEKISIPMESNEHVVFMEDGRIYFEAWLEEGWDEEKECATEQYRNYYKIIIRDYEGNRLSEEVGNFYQAADGTWWMA